MAGKRRISGTQLPPESVRTNNSGQPLPDGMYIARVIDNVDATSTGKVSVTIGEFESDATYSALMMTPMGGITNTNLSGENVDVEDQSPSSFGMWTPPPAIGTPVMVQFSAGISQPVLLGGLMTSVSNHNMGGNASGENKDGSIGPVAEQNPHDTDSISKPLNQTRTDQLATQGLDNDFVRGHSMSSARRESPSRVTGFTTPGGAVLTMDDGAADGSGSTNIRLRTPGGAQVLLDDSTGIVFITNQEGTAHIEMNANGNIDIFSTDSFSIATTEDINMHAEGNINMQADQGINIAAGTDIKVKAEGDTNINATNHKETASKIYMNSSTSAEPPVTGGLPENKGVSQSVAGRVPEKHPYLGVPGVQEEFTTGEGKPS